MQSLPKHKNCRETYAFSASFARVSRMRIVIRTIITDIFQTICGERRNNVRHRISDRNRGCPAILEAQGKTSASQVYIEQCMSTIRALYPVRPDGTHDGARFDRRSNIVRHCLGFSAFAFAIPAKKRLIATAADSSGGNSRCSGTFITKRGSLKTLLSLASSRTLGSVFSRN
jgi:hypothetical protein